MIAHRIEAPLTQIHSLTVHILPDKIRDPASLGSILPRRNIYPGPGVPGSHRPKVTGDAPALSAKMSATTTSPLQRTKSADSMEPVSPWFDESSLDVLYPCVVPKSWVQRAGESSLVGFQFSDEVRVVLVVDDEDALRPVNPADLESIEVSPEQAFSLATDNLGVAWQRGAFEFVAETLKDGTRIALSMGNWMAPAGGLLLLDFFEALKNDFAAERFAAVALNQECLFAFPTDERTLRSTALLVAMEEQINGHRQPISRSLLLLEGNWPRAFSKDD